MKLKLNQLKTILLLSKNSDVALPVIRALSEVIPRHVSLCMLSHHKELNFSRYSRHIKSHVKLKSQTKQEFYKELKRLTEASKPAIVLPLDEYYIRLFGDLDENLRTQFFAPSIPDSHIFDKLVHKRSLGELLTKNGLPTPKNYEFDQSSLAEIDDSEFPLLLKPTKGSSGHGIQKVRDKEELKMMLQRLNTSDFILQEIIPGIDMDCSLYAENGKIKAFTTQRGIQSRGFSFSTFIRFEQNKAIREITETLIKATNYSGIAHLDFRIDERDNQPKLVDFNARFWLSLLGSKAAGVNFAHLYCLAALKIPVKHSGFTEINYVMGRSTFSYYYGRAFRLAPQNGIATHTDLRDRLTDPLPEFIRLFQPKANA